LTSITRHPTDGVTAAGGTSTAHDLLAALGWIPQHIPGRISQTLPVGLSRDQERWMASQSADLLHAAGHAVEIDPGLEVETVPLLSAAVPVEPGAAIAALSERLAGATDGAQIAEITAQVTDKEAGAITALFGFFGAAVEQIAQVTGFAPDADPQVQARLDEAMEAATVFTLDEADIPAALDHLLGVIEQVVFDPSPAPEPPAPSAAQGPAARPIAPGETPWRRSR
jgi:hypothetical protein